MLKKILEDKFEIIYSIYLTLKFIQISTLVIDYAILQPIIRIILIGIYFIFIIKILFKYKEYFREIDILGWKNKSNIEKFTIILIFVFAVSILINFITTRNTRMIILVILLLAGYKTDYKKIIKYTMLTQIILTTIITTISTLGITQNYSVGRGTEKLRYCLGFGYPTSLSQVVLFASLLYLYTKKFKVDFILIGIIQVINNCIFFITDSRAEFIFLEFIILISILHRFNIISKTKKYCKKILDFFSYTFCLYPIMSFFVVMAYPVGGIFSKINFILSNRLRQQYFMISGNGLRLFGENIKLIGGGIWEANEYKGLTVISNYIDNEYIQIMVKEGILIAIIFIILLNILLVILYKKKKYYDIFLCSIYLMFGIINPRIVDLIYCPILFIMIPTFLQYFKEKRKYE